MENNIIITRFLLPLVSIGIVFVVNKSIKPPKEVFLTALKFCWVAGVVNLIVDIFQEYFRFWHYTINYSIFGFPIDLYFSVSLIIGIAISVLYWWLIIFHKKYALAIIVLINIYLVLQDYLVFTLGGDLVIVRDNQYWWVIDYISIALIIWITIFVFNYFLLKKMIQISNSTNT